MKVHPHKGTQENRKGAHVFTSPADKIKPDNRSTDNNTTAVGEEYVCWKCGATVKLIKAPFSDIEVGIRKNDPLIPNHRPGGGRAAKTGGRFDASCFAGMGVPQ